MPSQVIKDKGKVFRDPVHRLIRIDSKDQFILDLINCPEFQRLRRVRQLGVSSLTYHGAEHSRFVHSLGVFNFAQRIIAALQQRYGAGHPVTTYLEKHNRVAKAAALLHDLGHGPFSHMIERAAGSTFDHEQMTSQLITGTDGGIRAALLKYDINPQDVADVISKTSPQRLIVDIVSSQLDADRMDYLLRDSLMTGVEYGLYDSDWLINALCVGMDPSEDHWRLCLDKDRGMSAAEQLIIARHHMMLQVYMHRVTRGYEVMLLNAFAQAAKLFREGKLTDKTASSVAKYFEVGIKMSLSDWLCFDETALTASIQAWSSTGDPDHAWLCRAAIAFLQRDRFYEAYRAPDVATAMKLEGNFRACGLEVGTDWSLDDGSHLPYKGVIYSAKKGDEEEMSSISILLSDGRPDIRAQAVEGTSPILKGLDGASQPFHRLYVDRSKLVQGSPVLNKLRKA